MKFVYGAVYKEDMVYITKEDGTLDPVTTREVIYSSELFKYDTFESFQVWVSLLTKFEFDIETTVTPFWSTRKIITVQFGWGDTQWVIQWSVLTAEQKDFITEILEGWRTKMIHNAMFECVTCLFHGIRIQNVVDTMLAEQIIYSGDYELMSYGLDDVCQRRLGITLDKTYQTAFGDDILTEGKVVYAAQDVMHLYAIHLQQHEELRKIESENVAALEYEAVLAFAEMTYHGMEMDVAWWRELQGKAEPLVAAAHEKLSAWLRDDPRLHTKALQLGYISNSDRVLLNWNSPVQSKRVFEEFYPELPGATKAVLQKYLKTCIKEGDTYPDWLPAWVDGDKSGFTDYLLENHRDWLIDEAMLIPAGQCTINWGSVTQVLPLMQVVEPKLKDLSAESLGKTSHPIVQDYEDYKDSQKLISAFGEKFLEKYLEPDGKVRTSFKQILSTGRIASSAPNMQQIPAKEAVGNLYRNGFICDPGWKFCSSDFVSQELIVIAYLSKDPVWTEALSKGQDLHSIAAELVFKHKWRDAAEHDCAFYVRLPNGELQREKCKCKAHKYMRNGVKTINFGLAYGMSHFKLAGTLRISEQDAKQLIADYFVAFPGIGALLEELGQFGVRNGYIKTLYPFYRRRYFPKWEAVKDLVPYHLGGTLRDKELGAIERASKNCPIQGSSADMCKVAVIIIYWYIHDNHLEDKVKLIMQVHDQVDTIVREDFAEQWKPILSALMQYAAAVVIPTGILKADTTITDRWSK